MIKTINFSDFVDAFKSMGREKEFSYDGLRALFDYLESTETETELIELDVIALCCEYSEYENLKEFQKEYGEEYETIEDIERITLVIDIDGEGFIISDF